MKLGAPRVGVVLGSGLGAVADAVGMSTVQETILARHCGLRVAAVSVITNLAEGMSEEPISHEQTLRAAQDGAGDLTRLLLEFIPRLRADADRLRRG